MPEYKFCVKVVLSLMKLTELSDLFKVWGKIGLISFGGPAGQIALMHSVIVEEKKWLSEKEYLNALSFCMLLPGPEAMQLATYSGWRLRGVIGGLISGLLFILPGAAIVLMLSVIYLLYGNTPILETLFLGIKAAVLVIVTEALRKVARKNLVTKAAWITAALSFFALFFINLPFPFVILCAAFLGFINSSQINHQKQNVILSVNAFQTLKTAAFWLTLWFLPLGLFVWLGAEVVLSHLWIFFSKLAIVTFGGAYSGVAYIAQDAVNTNEWLTATEMMDVLGLVEATPGPLILVTEFVGFLVAARLDTGINIWMGVGGAFVTLWVTFVPCFLCIFVGAPYVDWMSNKSRFSNSLSYISAAVVGVILNLSLWFSFHVLFGQVGKLHLGLFTVWVPDLTSINLLVLGLVCIATIIHIQLKLGVLFTLTFCSVLGLLLRSFN